jgi:hypothetical protein
LCDASPSGRPSLSRQQVSQLVPIPVLVRDLVKRRQHKTVSASPSTALLSHSAPFVFVYRLHT